MKSESLNLLEPCGPHWACHGTPLLFYLLWTKTEVFLHLRPCQLINTQLMTWVDVICEQDVAGGVVHNFIYFIYFILFIYFIYFLFYFILFILFILY